MSHLVAMKQTDSLSLYPIIDDHTEYSVLINILAYSSQKPHIIVQYDMTTDVKIITDVDLFPLIFSYDCCQNMNDFHPV